MGGGGGRAGEGGERGGIENCELLIKVRIIKMQKRHIEFL